MTLSELFNRPKTDTELAYLLLFAAQNQDTSISQITFDNIHGDGTFARATTTLSRYEVPFTIALENIFLYVAPTTRDHVDSIARLVLKNTYENVGIIDQHSLARDDADADAFLAFEGDPVIFRATWELLLIGANLTEITLEQKQALKTLNRIEIEGLLGEEMAMNLGASVHKLYDAAKAVIGKDLPADSIEDPTVKAEKDARTKAFDEEMDGKFQKFNERFEKTLDRYRPKNG